MAGSSGGHLIVDLDVDATLSFQVPARTVDSGLICITLSLVKKSGQMARLRIQADESVTINRPRAKRIAQPA